MRRFNLLLTLGAGLLVFLVSGTASYFWASMDPSGSRQVTPVQQRSSKPSPDASSSTAKSSTLSDTKFMEYDDWEAFLAYEGERRLMLGIRKEYSAVNFRSGPSTGYTIRATPSGGELLVPLDRINQWYRARLKDGTVGWIHKSLVRKLRVPLPVAQRFEENLPSLKKSTKQLIPASLREHNRISIAVEKANLRRGPGTQFSIIHRLYRFEEARLLGKQESWYRVKTAAGQVGWVYGPLVQPIWLREPGNRPTISFRGGQIRMGPEFQFRNTATDSTANRGAVLEVQKPWVLVKVSDAVIGWVHQDEVKGSIPAPIE